MALTDKLTAVADAIREKTNTSEKITLAQMPELIAGITGGGSSSAEQYVNFYDYDGTLLHQYPLSVFSNMSALPLPPSNLKGCTCTGWNYDIDTIKAMNSTVNVAAIYAQPDKDAETLEESDPEYVDGTKLYVHIEQARSITLYFRQTVASGVTINWGDGSSTKSSTSKDATNLSATHAYAAGDYVISFDLADGCTLSLGAANTSVCVFGTTSFSNTVVPKLTALVKAEIDLRNTIPLSSAFRFCIGLKEVVFGNGNSYALQTYLFDGCYALEEVTLSTSVTGVSDYAFRYCYRLREIELPASLTSIGNYAFAECRRLRQVEIPGTVKTINAYAFQTCTALKTVTLGSGVTTINSYAFTGCTHLAEVDLPNSITTLGVQAFYQCYALTELILPNKLTTLGQQAFQSCVALKTVVIPEGVTTIGSSAFSGCNTLQFVGFPKSVTTISASAFSDCYSLRNAVFGINVKSIGGSAFQSCYTLEYLILPQSVTTLGTNAFNACGCLKEIIMPEALQNVTGAIINCHMNNATLESLTNTMLQTASELRDYAFASNRYTEAVELSSTPTTLGAYAFRYNYNLKSIELPARLTSIGNYAFQYDYKLGTVSIPATVKTIGQEAFEYCATMPRIVLPASVTTIGTSAFLSCYSLEQIELRANNMTIGTTAFQNTYRLKELVIPESLTKVSLGSSCFINSGIEKIVGLPEKTTFAEASCFNGCMALEKADISTATGTSTNRYNTMFQNCYALTEVELPDDTFLGASMFQNCFALEHVVIGEECITINANAFYECRNLQKVTFLGSALTTIYSNAFYNCYRLTEMSIPHKVTTMQSCFTNCYNLAVIYMHSLTAPTGVTSLGTLADGYVIYVPKGHLSSYESQWTSHKGHFEEFEFMIASNVLLRKTIGLADSSVSLKNAFVHTSFDEEQTFTIIPTYTGSNLTAISNLTFDYENSLVSFDFERAAEMDYDAQETVAIQIQVDGTDIACDFALQLRYVNAIFVSEYEVVALGGTAYTFDLDEDGYYYVSSNKGVQNSYAMCKLTFTSSTGKMYLDCVGGGEANFDFGIVSELDNTLVSSNNTDSGTTVKKSFQGSSSYTQTIEYDVEDAEEHFVYIKYRKDGSVDTSPDCLKFHVRFEDE